MTTNQSKLFDVAKHLGDLNKQGCVKGFNGNENGYAKIIQICRGCSIWIHHELNETLIIDLLISPSAQKSYPEKCSRAVRLFKEFFSFSVDNSKWIHAIDTQNEHDRYYVNATDLSTEEIIKTCNEIKRIYA